MKLHRYFRSTAGAIFTLIILGIDPAPRLRAQPPADAQSLKIVVLEGEDGVNIVKKKSAVRPVVEVRDKNDLPVAGASVIFLLPNSGASATINGSRSLTLLTDSAGRATITGMKPVGSGAFKIQVSVSFHGQTAATSISQTNYLTVAAAHAAGASGGAAAGGAAGGLSGAAIAGIIGGVAAAAAVGIVAGTRGGGTKTPPTTTTPQGSISLGTGPVVFGPPH